MDSGPAALVRRGSATSGLSPPQKDQHCTRDPLLSFSLFLSYQLFISSHTLSFLPFIPPLLLKFPSPVLLLRILCKNRDNIDRCEMERKGKPPRHDQPSFSSTLLDAIYRSMDESEGTGTEPGKRVPKQSERLCYELDSWKSSGSLNHHRSSARTKPSHAPGRHRSGGWAHSTSSSSEGSSYGGFSSSEAESVRLRPIRTAPRPDPVQYHFPVQSTNCTSTSTENKKNKSSSIKSRIKEFRKTKNQLPASPGARLTSILNALFPKKTSSASTKGGGQAPEVGSTCSSASSYTRSCLSKTPSTVKRSVRFCPVSVVVGEEAERGDRRREGEGKKRVEEILRGLERDEEEEEEDSSDSSSDLFELEDLTVGIERRFRHELPVYCTTSLGSSNNNNKGVSHGLCRPVI
ncbi:hypothetical protein LUZ63_018702 [Rhynchospora breviuscula]|uniref:Protein BIG GRAIN 1-like B n=1 Tax=Rhynchospora breviuscula TaxID=2022672 RepID=A0A9Q0HHZ8_9POAL|nr:hypothetical protein LUZ63_018702 [Rhynchospora breviuscula]